jgi:hypothetical protein
MGPLIAMSEIGNNRIARKIDISPDKLEYLKKVEKSKVTEVRKYKIFKRVAGGFFCLWRGIPKHKVIYRIEGAVMIEKYCNKCIKKQDKREQVI